MPGTSAEGGTSLNAPFNAALQPPVNPTDAASAQQPLPASTAPQPGTASDAALNTPAWQTPASGGVPLIKGESGLHLPAPLLDHEQAIMRAARETHQAPEVLAGQIWQESRGKTEATTVNGGNGLSDSGLMQVNSNTFADLQSRYPHLLGPDASPSAPEDSIMAGALYLKEQRETFGDWTDANKDPKSRADAAYNMACVLNSIKGLNARDGSERKEISANDKIEGITKDGDARHGTEAGVLKDIAEQGLKMLPENKQLPETNDSHVRMDGTNKDNFQWGMGEFGKILSNIPILKSVAAPFFNNIGEARNLGEVFTGGLKGLAEGGMSVARGPIGWGITAATDTVQIAVENSGGKGKNEPPPFA